MRADEAPEAPVVTLEGDKVCLWRRDQRTEIPYVVERAHVPLLLLPLLRVALDDGLARLLTAQVGLWAFWPAVRAVNRSMPQKTMHALLKRAVYLYGERDG